MSTNELRKDIAAIDDALTETTTPKGYRIDIEYDDGSCGTYLAESLDEAWQLIQWLDRRGGFKSAWRDNEPWLGDCTRDDLP